MKDTLLDLLPGSGCSSLATKDFEHGIWARGFEIAPSEKQYLRCRINVSQCCLYYVFLCYYDIRSDYLHYCSLGTKDTSSFGAPRRI